MVSNEEGERLRKEENERQEKIKAQLIGATVTDVIFSGCGITNHTIQELFLDKEGVKYQVEIEAEQFYECITSRLVVTDKNTMNELV
jgi:deoxyhypusine synthase